MLRGLHAKELGDCIEAARVVSFDVFDTLFVRPLLDPEDVFDIVGERCGIPNFRRIRREAQAEAFRRMVRNGRKEITLDDIYACLPKLAVPSEKLKHAEYAVELALTKPNPDLVDVFLNAVATRPVVLTSDMYLPQDFFEALLDKYGLPQVPLFISSARGATKRDHGELFDHVLEHSQVQPYELLHIGDNPVSDIARARQRGLSAYHYSAVAQTCPSARGPSASLAASIHKFREGIDTGTYYGLGFRCGGPAALGFLSWVREQAEADKIDKLLFVSRDGYVLERLARRGDVVGLPAFAYMPGSRVAFGLAAMDEANFTENIRFLLSGSHGLMPSEVLERIGVPPPAQSVMRDLGLGDEVVVSDNKMLRMRSFLYAYRSEILKVCQRNRRGLFKLLGLLGIRPGMRVALVDVGWNGTTQETFQHAMLKQFHVDVHGYYFCLTDSLECKRRREELKMKALLSEERIGSAMVNRLYARRILIELMFSAPHQTVIGYEPATNGKVLPIEDAGRGEIKPPHEVIKDIVRGIEDFSQSFGEVCRDALFKADAFGMVQSTLDFVDGVDASTLPILADIKNFDAWGSSKRLELTMRHYVDAVGEA